MRQITTFEAWPVAVWGHAYQQQAHGDRALCAIGADGWDIYNAPRPLFGTVTWESPGSGLVGYFYAAIAPESVDPLAESWRDHNRRMDAIRVRYVDRGAELEAYRHRRAAQSSDPEQTLAYYADNPLALEHDWVADKRMSEEVS